MGKALVWHLRSVKELANCGLLKVEKQQMSYKDGTQKLKSKMQRTSKVFRTQDGTKCSWVMKLDVKSCQVK